jgi:hypothetical protein
VHGAARPGEQAVADADTASQMSGSRVTVPARLSEVTQLFVLPGASTTRLLINEPRCGPVIGFQGKLQVSEGELIQSFRRSAGPGEPGEIRHSEFKIVTLSDGTTALTGRGNGVMMIEFGKSGIRVSLRAAADALSPAAAVELASEFAGVMG